MSTCDNKKRKSFSISDKVEVIRALERGERNSTVSKKYNLSQSTVSTIWKNRETIIKAFEENNAATKRVRKCEKHEIDKALIKWFSIQKRLGVPVNGPMLRAQAEVFAAMFGYENFVCSNGWLDRFKIRHNISYGKEALSKQELTTSWLDSVWPDLSKNHSPENIYLGNESGVFYNVTPDQTLKFSGQKCINGELTKNRLTIFLCYNLTGNDKRELLVIGKTAKLRCFRNVKRLPVNYVTDENAWMTSEIFVKYIKQWDNELWKKDRKILLLVDSCSARPLIENLKNITIHYLPPKATVILQPIVQGVVKSFKTHYRRQLLLSLNDKTDFKINVLKAIHLLKDAWESIPKNHIKNYFLKIGLLKDELIEIDDELPLNEWLKRNNLENVPNIDCFFDIDEDLVTTKCPTTKDIVESVLESEKIPKQDSSDDDDSCDEQLKTRPILSCRQLLEHVEDLQHYFEARSDTSDEAFTALSVIRRLLREETELEGDTWKSLLNCEIFLQEGIKQEIL